MDTPQNSVLVLFVRFCLITLVQHLLSQLESTLASKLTPGSLPRRHPSTAEHPLLEGLVERPPFSNLYQPTNTSLAAPGALAHRLERRTTCNISPPAVSKMADRTQKQVKPQVIGPSDQLLLNEFFIPSFFCFSFFIFHFLFLIFVFSFFIFRF